MVFFLRAQEIRLIEAVVNAPSPILHTSWLHEPVIAEVLEKNIRQKRGRTIQGKYLYWFYRHLQDE